MQLYKTGSLEIVALGSTFLQLQSFHFPPRAGTIPAFQVSPFVSWSLLFYQICICTSALSWDFKHTLMHKISKPTGNWKNCKAMRNPLEKQPWSALEPDKQLLRPWRPSPSPTSTSHGAHNCLSRPSATGTLTQNAEASLRSQAFLQVQSEQSWSEKLEGDATTRQAVNWVHVEIFGDYTYWYWKDVLASSCTSYSKWRCENQMVVKNLRIVAQWWTPNGATWYLPLPTNFDC